MSIRRTNTILEAAGFGLVEIVENGSTTVFNDTMLGDHVFVRCDHIVYQDRRGHVVTINEAALSADAWRQVRHSRARMHVA